MVKSVPFFRPIIGEKEMEEVVAVLQSGWLTTGARVKRFEEDFATAVGSRYAIAVNSCTSALHLAVEALGLGRDDAVLVPTMTFASTAEVVRYQGAVPILVDCEPDTLNMNLEDAERKCALASDGKLPGQGGTPGHVVGIIPVHVGGHMMNVNEVNAFAKRHGIWVVEDAAHAFPAAWRPNRTSPWQRSGEKTADVTCFSFYANKTITTGEGGMAVTQSSELADRMRIMSLHGLSKDAWSRYSGSGKWDYKIIAPGYKYNMTDVLAAIGIHQLSRAELMRLERQRIADFYYKAFSEDENIELPPFNSNRILSWHLFPIRLNLATLSIDRDRFVQELKMRGVGFSVHWRPLHLHPYYSGLGWKKEDCIVASKVWKRLISLPIFPGMSPDESEQVRKVMYSLLQAFRK